MKKVLSVVMMLIFSLPVLINAQTTSSSKVLKPTNYQKRVTTIVSGKTRYYYSLSPDKTSVLSVQGPCKLQVVSRGRFKPETAERISYDILYAVDGGVQKKISVKDNIRSKTDTYLDGTLGIPGQSNDFTIDLGLGEHTVEFKLLDNKTSVAARYILTPVKEKKQEWIAFSPLQPSEPVDLISKEVTVSYYRFSNDKPLKIEVNGPTELKVMTRIENHYQMKGRIHYRIQVKENNMVQNTFQHSSERSETAVYKDNKELIPGKACEFVINVPKGKHNYEIMLLDEDKNSVLGRLLLPKKDTKLSNE
jgi:hypothetical protein